jgi:hypothetical protein
MTEPDLGAVNNKLRLKLDFNLSNRMTVSCAYEITARIQDHRFFTGEISMSPVTPPEYRLVDIRKRLYPGPGVTPESFAIDQNLDRFMLKVKTDAVDIFVGRQPIAWGSARIISPTDVIAPFAFNELDKEELKGVDAVRVVVPLGTMDELEGGIIAGKRLDPGENAFFLRGRTHQLKTDLSAMAMAFRNHFLFGLDIARSVAGMGLWLEAAYVIPDLFRPDATDKDSPYFRASIGTDFSLNDKTYGFIEYHFNGAGTSRPETSASLFQTTAYRDGSDYLLGRHYLGIGSTYQIAPLLAATGLVLFALSDESLMFAPNFEYNIAENIYLTAGGYLGIGKRPEIIETPPAPQTRLLHSEFGAYPDVIYTSIRVYF